ncbi:hypothetical protein [Nitratidesulfovibrio sp. SRB-5]|uniref:hypothetical protein n=1 Tax=Nitratidesulfovibrio sp. SRB-5 TaxID=2872636 RepID=UPI001028317A|nr:hypothetical protein [Nitratidesulfovibrio sp. SRB-5]MBZ2171383.1 hypothetical protein [Nitratidesulfovibrio sp. SRB-5]RXF77603.1 hypothetical protein EKK70_05760 [Desulfovibrio sp. DS-1]
MAFAAFEAALFPAARVGGCPVSLSGHGAARACSVTRDAGRSVFVSRGWCRGEKKIDARAIFGRNSRMCLWKSFFVDVENRGSRLWKVLPAKVSAKRRNDAIEWLDSVIAVGYLEKSLGKQGASYA